MFQALHLVLPRARAAAMDINIHGYMYQNINMTILIGPASSTNWPCIRHSAGSGGNSNWMGELDWGSWTGAEMPGH